MSTPTAFAGELLRLILEGVAIANIADNAASSPVATLYLSLHTASPGASGTQATNETAYTGYGRVSIDRSSSGWTLSSNSESNDAEKQWAICTASPGSDITHLGIGTASSGAGKLLFYGELDDPIAMQVGTRPTISPTALAVLCS
jgi:hypothetical protein